MAALYSMDLRKRSVQAVGSRAGRGYHRRDVRRESGVGAPVDAAPTRNGQHRARPHTEWRRRVLADEEEHLRELVAAQPDRTLGEIQAALPTPASLTTFGARCSACS